MSNEKIKCIKEIEKAIKNAVEQGYKVVVASDPEGNSWNSINPAEYAMFYGDSKEKYIAIGVWEENIPEEEIFNINKK